MVYILNLFFQLAVLQQNLSAVHDIWKEWTKYYNLSIISLRKFIQSFARLRDLNSANVVLQHMLALALQGGQVIIKAAEGKLTSPRLDVPIPSNSELNLEKCSKDNETSVPSVVEHCNNVDIREVRNERLNKCMSVPVMTILRWSFTDVIHACAQIKNSGLAENLILQVAQLCHILFLNVYLLKVIVSSE